MKTCAAADACFSSVVVLAVELGGEGLDDPVMVFDAGLPSEGGDIVSEEPLT